MPADPQSSNLEYIKLGVSFLSGGFLGAILNNVIMVYRNRVQPVRYRSTTTSIFADNLRGATVEAKVSLSEAGAEYRFNNLFLTELTITNSGNQHIKEFTLGITTTGTTQLVGASCDPQDRHHTAGAVVIPKPSAPTADLDYVLKPFNRGDRYSFRILSTCPQNKEPGKISLSSSEAVRFVSYQNLIESLDLIEGLPGFGGHMIRTVVQVSRTIAKLI